MIKLCVFPSILITFLLTACQSESPPNLNGHWHILHPEIPNYYDSYLEIEDTLGVFNAKIHEGSGIQFYVDKDQYELRIFTDGLQDDLPFYLKDDTLYFRNYAGKQKAVRAKPSHCNLEKERFINYNVYVDLPSFNSDKMLSQIAQKSLEHDFYIGTFLPPYQKKYSDSIYVTNGYKILEKEDYQLNFEKHQIKVPEQSRKKTYAVLYADKNTPLVLIQDIIKFYHAKNLPVYLAVEEIGEQEKFEVRYLNVKDLPDFLDSLSSQEILQEVANY